MSLKSTWFCWSFLQFGFNDLANINLSKNQGMSHRTGLSFGSLLIVNAALNPRVNSSKNYDALFCRKKHSFCVIWCLYVQSPIPNHALPEMPRPGGDLHAEEGGCESVSSFLHVLNGSNPMKKDDPSSIIVDEVQIMKLWLRTCKSGIEENHHSEDEHI